MAYSIEQLKQIIQYLDTNNKTLIFIKDTKSIKPFKFDIFIDFTNDIEEDFKLILYPVKNIINIGIGEKILKKYPNLPNFKNIIRNTNLNNYNCLADTNIELAAVKELIDYGIDVYGMIGDCAVNYYDIKEYIDK